MKIYMLKRTDTGQYYKRVLNWTDQEHASVWTQKSGPAACKGNIANVIPLETVELVAFEVSDE